MTTTPSSPSARWGGGSPWHQGAPSVRPSTFPIYPPSGPLFLSHHGVCTAVCFLHQSTLSPVSPCPPWHPAFLCVLSLPTIFFLDTCTARQNILTPTPLPTPVRRHCTPHDGRDVCRCVVTGGCRAYGCVARCLEAGGQQLGVSTGRCCGRVQHTEAPEKFGNKRQSIDTKAVAAVDAFCAALPPVVVHAGECISRERVVVYISHATATHDTPPSVGSDSVSGWNGATPFRKE